MRLIKTVTNTAVLLLLVTFIVIVSTGCKAKVTNQSDNSVKSSSVTNTEANNDVITEPIVGKINTYDASRANYTLNIDAAAKLHDISDLLYGAFFEDINFAADGGLYAEMVRNRSFEYTVMATDDEKNGWITIGQASTLVKVGDTNSGLNINNTNYMVIDNKTDKQSGIANIGFLDGMSVKKNNKYTFTVYAKGLDNFTGPISINLMMGSKKLASGKIKKVTSSWKKYELELTSNQSASAYVMLQLTIGSGKVALDMVSLFPNETFKNRKNGLRSDLMVKLVDLKPKFLRFPGGCVIEGRTLEEAYDWKNSIGIDKNRNPLLFNGTYGDVAARKMGNNIWANINSKEEKNPTYMTYGLGFYEYFLAAEDMGALGVPFVNPGLTCVSRTPGLGYTVGEEGLNRYIQDALDLVEFCRGDQDTKWGAVRIAMGHKEPFQLKYIGIGNEQTGSKFFNNYAAFVAAFDKAKKENPEMYGDIQLIFSAAIDDADSGAGLYYPMIDFSLDWLKKHPGKTINNFTAMLDQHYYNDPYWFLENTDYYDEKNYSRTIEDAKNKKFFGGMDVFVGEYAAKSNKMKSALSEAAYMTGLERNGDIVKMAAYAPLFGNRTVTHWAPNLIWFNNHTVSGSANYYVQKIFSLNAGTQLLDSELKGAEVRLNSFSGNVGVGTWNTTAYFDNISIKNNNTKQIIASDDFSKDTLSDKWTKVSDGNWKITDSRLYQSSRTTDTGIYGNTGTAIYFGDKTWTNYTYTVEATKTGGDEGFLIPFYVGDKNNNYFWNIGGWGNTVSALQKVHRGAKSGQLHGTTKNIRIENNKTYQLKIVVTNSNVKCYVDDVLYIDYDMEYDTNAEAYQVVSTDPSGDIIIKLVNVTQGERTFAINISNVTDVNHDAKAYIVAGDSLDAENILGAEDKIKMITGKSIGVSKNFNYSIPKCSVVVLRIKAKVSK